MDNNQNIDIFCSKCGTKHAQGAAFCTSCGAKLGVDNRSNNFTTGSVNTRSIDIRSYASTLSAKENTSGIIWIVIGIIQCLSLYFILAGVYNIVMALQTFKKSKKVLEPYYGMVEEYDGGMKSLIITLVWNIIFGGVFGIIGSFYDMSIRSYVLSNAPVFNDYISQKYQNACNDGKALVIMSFKKDYGMRVGFQQITISGEGIQSQQYKLMRIGDTAETTLPIGGTYTFDHYFGNNLQGSHTVTLDCNKVVAIEGQQISIQNL